METDDVFTDQMQVCRPEFVKLFCAFAIAVVADSCNIVCKGIKPYIYYVFRIKVYRDFRISVYPELPSNGESR